MSAARTSQSTPVSEQTVVGNTLLLVGDILMPGTSLLVESRFKEAVAHSVLGWVGAATLGPIAWAVVAANAYSRSTTNKDLFENVFGSHSDRPPSSE